MGPETPHDGSPPLTPRSSRAAPSDEEEEEERPQARRKKTGDEPPSWQRSPEEQEDLQGSSQNAILRTLPHKMCLVELLMTDRMSCLNATQ